MEQSPIKDGTQLESSKVELNGNIDIRNRHLSTVQNIIFNDNNIDHLEWYGYDPSASIPEDIDLPYVIVDELDINENILHVIQTIDPYNLQIQWE